MILADTSAWVEYLRATGSLAHRRLRELIDSEAALATTEVVHLELLAGASDADLYRRCRLRGGTVRKLEDCLVAAVALRHGATLLHRDDDFEVIARHAPLRVMG